MPLVLLAALCRDTSNPFGDSEKCSIDGTAYISFGQWVTFLSLKLLTRIRALAAQDCVFAVSSFTVTQFLGFLPSLF